MKKLINISLFLFLVFTVVLNAQKNDYSKEPGYIDFGDISQFEDNEEFAEVILNERLLRMVSKLSKHEDPELADIISNLKLIKAYVFDATPESEGKIKAKMKLVEKQLKEKDWEKIVTARSHGDRALVYIKIDSDENIEGLVITAYESDDKVAFINIVGKIDLEKLGRLSDKFNIPTLGGFEDDKWERKSDRKKDKK